MGFLPQVPGKLCREKASDLLSTASWTNSFFFEGWSKKDNFFCLECLKDGFPVSPASGPSLEELARCQKAAGE